MTVAISGRRALRSAERRHARGVIAGHVMRSALRGAVIWGVVFGLWVISTIKAFVSGYPTVSERVQLARSLQAFAMILGQTRHAETVAGFTTWRVLVVIVTIGAIWGLLTSTALLRGEEEAGRWEMLLAGRTTKRRATAQALLGLGGAWAAMFVLTALLTLAAGRLPGAHFPIGGSILFAWALVSGAAMFLMVGALTSQLSATRGQAAMLAAAVLAGAYALRMVADSQNNLGWLRWLSPIGWIEELHPLQDVQLMALVPIVGLMAICAGLTVLLAGGRDLNASVLREAEGRRGVAWWLVGPTSLALRVSGTAALAWLGGAAAMAAVYGSLARASTKLILSSSPAILATLSRLGVRKATEGFLGIVFLFVAVLIAVMAASQVAALRDEEGSGQLDNVLVRPVSRVTWLAGHVAVSLALVGSAGIVSAVFAWLGLLSQHTGVALPTLLEAGLNATVPGVFVLGAGVLVFGLRPRLSAVAAYGIVAWSFLVDLLGSLVKGNNWLRDSSLFTHLALLPAAKADWGTAAIVVGLGVAAAVMGAVAFQRRDIAYH